MENREVILSSVPEAKGGGESELARVKRACCQEQDLCVAYRFELPPLRIGTLDALMALCDDLARIDTHIESVCRRVACRAPPARSALARLIWPAAAQLVALRQALREARDDGALGDSALTVHNS